MVSPFGGPKIHSEFARDFLFVVLTLSLPALWHHMTSLTSCFLSARQTSRDVLLQFWLLMQTQEKQSWKINKKWTCLTSWIRLRDTFISKKLREQHTFFGREMVNRRQGNVSAISVEGRLAIPRLWLQRDQGIAVCARTSTDINHEVSLGNHRRGTSLSGTPPRFIS